MRPDRTTTTPEAAARVAAQDATPDPPERDAWESDPTWRTRPDAPSATCRCGADLWACRCKTWPPHPWGAQIKLPGRGT